MTFKYPSVKTLVAKTGTNLVANPPGRKNPPEWEVRSSIGLESTHATEAEAQRAADVLRKQGVSHVVVKMRPPPTYHARQGPPPGVPTRNTKNPCGPRRNPPEVEQGMARALFLDVFASSYEEMDPATREAHGLPRSASGLDYDDFAPATPAWAYAAADLLYEKFEELNDKPMAAILGEAEAADRAPMAGLAGWPRYEIGSDAYLDMFGHCLAMQAMGHGVSWFDDHAKFPLKFPRIDAWGKFDGDLGLAPKKRSKR